MRLSTAPAEEKVQQSLHWMGWGQRWLKCGQVIEADERAHQS